MKFFIAPLATETNTFAPAPTGLGGFEEYGIFHGDASRRDPGGTGAFMRFLRDLIEADGHEVAESLCAIAQPSGRTVRHVYEALRDEILADLRAAMPVDAVQLLLHGAMAAEGYDDCEGDLAAHIRAVVGPDVAIGLELDLHCHLTALMQRSATAIVAFKEYPHIDAEPRGRELYRLLVDTAAGRVRPVTATFDCKMVGLWHTTREPMQSFVARMQALEGEPGVLSISLGHGFPWGDVPEAGAKLWVVTDDDPALARSLAEQLGREFWALREAIGPELIDVDGALDRALAMGEGTVVLADIAITNRRMPVRVILRPALPGTCPTPYGTTDGSDTPTAPKRRRVRGKSASCLAACRWCASEPGIAPCHPPGRSTYRAGEWDGSSSCR